MKQKRIIVKKTKELLGDLVITFSNLEDALSEGLAEITDLSYHESKIIFSAVSFRKKIQILKAFLRDKELDYLDIIENLTIAFKLENERNALIHSNWEYYSKKQDKDTYEVFLKRSKLKYPKKEKPKLIQTKYEKEESERFNKVIEEIDLCIDDLITGFIEIGKEIRSKS